MTNQQHPITPPPELVSQWFFGARAMPVNQWVTDVATQAAQWGADQELEACCEVLHQHDHAYLLPSQLRAARRPKPPSLKEQALDALGREEADSCSHHNLAIIRRALEALDD